MLWYKADDNDYWYRQDIRGSVTNIVDVDDDVVKSYTYDAMATQPKQARL